MAMQKTLAGSPIARGQRNLIWVVLGVFCLVLAQFFAFEQAWSSRQQSSIRRSNKASKAMLMKSSFASDYDYGIKKIQDLRLLREMIMRAGTPCNSSADGGSENWESGKTSMLPSNHQSLQSWLMPPSQQEESSQDEVHKRRMEALENEVDTLSVTLKNCTVFLDLKDTRVSGSTKTSTNWFMSSIHWPDPNAKTLELFEFPSEASDGRLLCLMGNHRSDGTRNKYGFAWKGYLPPNATLLPGITLVADNYWDYTNIWHAMSALVGFVWWRGKNECAVPQRMLLYHWGEVVHTVAPWILNVLHASFGRKLEVETLEQAGSEGSVVCLERAIVNRRGLGHMAVADKNPIFDTIRCRSRKYCGAVLPEAANSSAIHVTLLLRTGARAFKNETAVRRVIEEVCEEEGNCHLEVAYASNLSFCEQVALMSRTDVLMTTHGAQMTNGMFMSKGGSVMEFIPKGWFEFAGVGQYIYSWMADWSNLNYEGVWRDPEGPECPYPIEERLNCFSFYKDRPIGHNETHLAEWTRKVVGNFKHRKQSIAIDTSKSMGNNCTCDLEDYTKADSLP